MVESASELVLVLAPVGRDALAAEQQLRAAGMTCVACTSLADLVARLRTSAGVAVIAEEAFARESADALNNWIAAQPAWSDFPLLILTSQQVSRREHAFRIRLLETLGNVALLERPLSAVSLISAIKTALRARRRQYEVREHLRHRERTAENLEKLVHDRTRQLLETNKRLRAEMAERKLAEAALQQAQKMEVLGQMTGGIAHDFNNLLTAVIGNLDLACRRVQDEKISRWLGGALQAAKRGANLTRQLLAFARKQHLQTVPTDLNTLIHDMGDLLVRTIGPTVRIETSFDQKLWPALIDASQVELIVLNLALNARDAMPDGGRLLIATRNSEPEDASRPPTLRLAGDYVCIAVSDTGIGMSEEVRAKAFEPFFTTKPAGAGTGLGLSQVYGIVRQLGGHVDIESELGKGTTIRLYFPRSRVEPTAKISEGTSREPELQAGATILIVDDDPDVRAFAVSCLESLGYETLVADSGGAALAILHGRKNIDLMLVDVIMPELQGPEVARRALAIRPALRILFMTGYMADAQGTVDQEQLLSKPFTVAEIASKVSLALAKRERSETQKIIPLPRRG